MKTKYTFWDLITKYRIEIPKIQRDYAQGRKDKEIEKIADKFLEDLLNSIINSNELNLDFVYGKVETDILILLDGQQSEIDILIPLDGQQRLTTLFLIHWYLALKENKLNDENKNTLLKFSYETRTSSQDFCKKLIEENINYSHDNKTISDTIVDSKWYFLSWELDPTVSSILNMLDKIHNKFKDVKEELLERLITENNSIITFQFLPLEQFKLTDELYIKMNARGKPLTVFENFKANFSGYLKNIEQKSKLDNEWLDIFWDLEKIKNGKIVTEKVDEKFFNFFKNISLNFYVETNDIDKSFIENYDLFDIYERVYENKNYVDNIVNILDSLTEFNDEKNIFSDFFKPHSQISYWERLRFYALSQFFIKFGKVTKNNEKILKRWLRVTKNLINNTLIQSADNYKDAIRSINELSENIEDIYNFINSSPDTIKYFAKLQRTEEKLKAKLILTDEDWENLFIEIEQRSYFDGQIGFIIEYSKNADENYDKKLFKEYSQKLSRLFSIEFQENHDFLFQRVLLEKGDYLPRVGNSDNYTFCVFDEFLRAKQDNWRKVFNDKEKTLFLKNLLDEIDKNKLLESLNNIVKNHKITDWKKYFIDNPNYISYCNSRLIRWRSEDEIYMLSKTQMNGRHRELYSWDLFNRSFENKIFTPFTEKLWYWESTSWDKPCIVIENFKYKAYSFAIDISYDKDNKYIVSFYDQNDIDIPTTIIERLEDIDFEENKIILEENKLESKIKALCEKLKEIKE